MGPPASQLRNPFSSGQKSEGATGPMRYLRIGILVLVGLLSLAAGGAKLAMAEQEVAFFRAIGLAPFWLIPLGIIQVGGAVLLLFSRMRPIGAWAIAAGFLLSTVSLLVSGNLMFAAISLIPVALAAYVALTDRRHPTAA